MTRINSVICELNPMHNGHKYVFDSMCTGERTDCVNIAVMSGNLTQRATPAIFDKYTRAEAALMCGADLVIELPFPWCSSGAEDFAMGGVSVACGVGAESLSFGSECGDIGKLHRIAEIKCTPEYTDAIISAESENRGEGSAVNFDSVMEKFGIDSPLGANDKLASEYIRFGKQMGLSDYRAIKRLEEIKSATEIRRLIFEEGITDAQKYIPEDAYALFCACKGKICREARYNELLFTYSRVCVKDTEENDLLRYANSVARSTRTSDEFIKELPTKKYTLARMRREILHSMLGVSENDRKNKPEFTLLLAANKKGREYLAEIRRKDSLPIITKPADTADLSETAKRQCRMSYAADELYSLCISESADHFIKKHPIII
ncbi:MAG: nucleotidyltransferase family protein [Ruminococcaceae bacterium]|nr:nucleotidyltransferase family protein [Oscillospiraceae bacterium]